MSTEHPNPPHTWEQMLETHSTMMDGIKEQRKHLQEQQAQLHSLYERQHNKEQHLDEQQSQLRALLERQLKKEQDLDERLEHFQTQREQFFEQQTHLQSQISAQLSAQPRGSSTTDSLSPPAKVGNKLTIKPKEYNGTSEDLSEFYL